MNKKVLWRAVRLVFIDDILAMLKGDFWRYAFMGIMFLSYFVAYWITGKILESILVSFSVMMWIVAVKTIIGLRRKK